MCMITLIKKIVKTITYSRTKFLTDSVWSKARHTEIINEGPLHWTCKYSGIMIADSSLVDIDHIVPLKFVWLRGADKWTATKRKLFATDVLNLAVTSQHENRSKGDDGLLEYLPCLNKDFYVDHWDKVCVKYDIELTEKEMDIIRKYKKSNYSTIL